MEQNTSEPRSLRKMNPLSALKLILLSAAGFTIGSMLECTTELGWRSNGIQSGLAAVLFSPISLTVGLVHLFNDLTAFHLACLFGGAAL